MTDSCTRKAAVGGRGFEPSRLCPQAGQWGAYVQLNLTLHGNSTARLGLSLYVPCSSMASPWATDDTGPCSAPLERLKCTNYNKRRCFISTTRSTVIDYYTSKGKAPHCLLLTTCFRSGCCLYVWAHWRLVYALVLRTSTVNCLKFQCRCWPTRSKQTKISV